MTQNQEPELTPPRVTNRARVRNSRGHNITVTDVMREVLALIVDAETPPWGYGLCQSTRRGTSDVYVALDRLMQAGLVKGVWEHEPPSGRPRRRLYYPILPASWYRQNGLMTTTPPPPPPPDGETH